MADHLSVSASIVGLMTAGAKVSQILAQAVGKARHAPRECHNVQMEVGSIRAILGQLQLFLLGTRSVSSSRASLILVDQVIATLAPCGATFSELDTLADTLKSNYDLGVLDRLRWVAGRHLSQKEEDAEDKVDRLWEVQQTLESNLLFARRLAAFETTHAQTLSEISHIGILTIPIYETDLSNKDAYDFDTTYSWIRRVYSERRVECELSATVTQYSSIWSRMALNSNMDVYWQ
ncbi:hypothetical protein F4824DRAFT_498161 [Ustulina deusta]|nr:hypothetical protein F4824DRAFT_498161 [Ustulina deusta]